MSKILKEFKLSTWSIHNKMTVFVMVVMIFLAGIFSYRSMPREAYPEIALISFSKGLVISFSISRAEFPG